MLPTVHGTRAAAARERIAELANQGLSPHDLIPEVAKRVRRIIPYDRAAWSTTDIETLLPTEWVLVEPDLDCDLNDRTARGEIEGDDVNRFADLERSGRHIATLINATSGDTDASARFRTVLAPRGFCDELRLLARSGDATWGTATLVRASDMGPFSADECRYLATIANHLGRGLRNGLLRSPLRASAAGAAGTLVLNGDRSVRMATQDAHYWLARLPTPYVSSTYVPPVINFVALQAQATRQAGTVHPPHVRTLIPGDGWLHIRAEVLTSTTGEPPCIGVMLEPAAPTALRPLLFAVHGLTRRERAVADLLRSGHDIDHIAGLLAISRGTVRDYTKSIFSKTGVSSRPELTAVLGA